MVMFNDFKSELVGQIKEEGSMLETAGGAAGGYLE